LSVLIEVLAFGILLALQALWVSIAASNVAATEPRSDPPEAGTDAYSAAYLAL
jgi:hypothetical protein